MIGFSTSSHDVVVWSQRKSERNSFNSHNLVSQLSVGCQSWSMGQTDRQTQGWWAQWGVHVWQGAHWPEGEDAGGPPQNCSDMMRMSLWPLSFFFSVALSLSLTSECLPVHPPYVHLDLLCNRLHYVYLSIRITNGNACCITPVLY